MNIRSQRRLYWLSAALLGVGTIAVWANGFQSPGIPASQAKSSTEELRISRKPEVNSPETAASGPIPALNDFRGLWDKPIRRALYDPPPPPLPAATPPPPLRLKLLGTVLESGRSEAILMAANGEVKMLRVGAVVDDATIKTIGDAQITVHYHGQDLTLTPQP